MIITVDNNKNDDDDDNNNSIHTRLKLSVLKTYTV